MEGSLTYVAGIKYHRPCQPVSQAFFPLGPLEDLFHNKALCASGLFTRCFCFKKKKNYFLASMETWVSPTIPAEWSLCSFSQKLTSPSSAPYCFFHGTALSFLIRRNSLLFWNWSNFARHPSTLLCCCHLLASGLLLHIHWRLGSLASIDSSNFRHPSGGLQCPPHWPGGR